MIEMEGPEVPAGAQAPLGESERPRQGCSSICEDPLYSQALEHIQRGRWTEAEAALAELGARYAGDAELARLQGELALHLSAEGTWLAGTPKRRGSLRVPRRRAVRILIAGNLVLYLLVAATWLLSWLRHLLG